MSEGTRLIPKNQRVAVLRDEVKYKGSIVIPETSERKATTGTVFAIAEDGPEEVSVGDTVLFKNGSGMEMTIAGKTILMLRPDDVLAVYEG